MPFPENETNLKNTSIIFATSKGKIRKNSLDDFTSINVSGKIAMKLDSDDKIIGVKICRDDQDIILSTRLGKCIRFESKKLRIFKGRSSKGIRGIALKDNDSIMSLSIIEYYKRKKINKILLACFSTFSLLTMFHSAFRIALAGYIYGLSYVILKINRK